MIVGTALLVLGGFVVGWITAKRIPDAPEGTDPEYWRDVYRAYRRNRS